jgi:hypothetical protein
MWLGSYYVPRAAVLVAVGAVVVAAAFVLTWLIVSAADDGGPTSARSSDRHHAERRGHRDKIKRTAPGREDKKRRDERNSGRIPERVSLGASGSHSNKKVPPPKPGASPVRVDGCDQVAAAIERKLLGKEGPANDMPPPPTQDDKQPCSPKVDQIDDLIEALTADGKFPNK